MTRYRYEIVRRPDDLGGGFRLRLFDDGLEVGGGVFPAGDSDASHDIAWCDAQCEGEAWLESRPKDFSSAHMLTCSGIDYVPGALRVQDVRIEDIAHALSLICRFGGHCAGRYSVAAHSLLVVRILDAMEAPPAALLCGLLHDAHEAYVGDVPTPIKSLLGTAWSDLEHQAEEAVLDAFGMRSVMNDWRDLVKHADRVALATERRDLLQFDGKVNLPWPILRGVEPFPERQALACLDPPYWAEAFQRRFVLLKAACDARSSMTT